MLCFVILSEPKNLSSISVQAKTEGEILRFAQNDNVFGFSAASLASLAAEQPLFLWFSHKLFSLSLSGSTSKAETRGPNAVRNTSKRSTTEDSSRRISGGQIIQLMAKDFNGLR